MILSSTGVWLNGMRRTIAASSGENKPFTKFASHVLVLGLMRLETLPSSKPGTISKRIRGCSCDGSHASFQILMRECYYPKYI